MAMNSGMTPLMGRLRDHDDMHPSSGLRILFELKSYAEERAEYAIFVFHAGGERLEGSATLTFSEPPELSLDGEQELTDYVARVGKVISRNAKSAAEMPHPWSRRVVRWRGPGRGS